MLPVMIVGLVSAALAGIAFSSMGYLLTITQTLMFAVELTHSLLAGALLGALVEGLTNTIPMQLVLFLYSILTTTTAAELLRRKFSADSVVALIASLSAVVSIASLWGLVYITPLGVSRALAALWGSALLATPLDIAYLAIAAVTVIMVITLFDLELKFISFDPELAFVSGLNVRAYYYLVYAVTSLSLSATVRILGTVLTSVLIVLPSVISQNLLKRTEPQIFMLTGLSISVSGYILSLLANMQTSLCVGLMGLTIALLAATIRWFYER